MHTGSIAAGPLSRFSVGINRGRAFIITALKGFFTGRRRRRSAETRVKAAEEGEEDEDGEEASGSPVADDHDGQGTQEFRT
ncbi:hypothetical protein K0M31_010575 [Melipona bicolor]|uniref:Uncharacterized protein n=1 Tax=Melipona bicolor TaxID=60889 RepID=A0AA40KID3_9HYME|nr:hypothetical protein K0M31_010575 [Melipona bicolor]